MSSSEQYTNILNKPLDCCMWDTVNDYIMTTENKLWQQHSNSQREIHFEVLLLSPSPVVLWLPTAHPPLMLGGMESGEPKRVVKVKNQCKFSANRWGQVVHVDKVMCDVTVTHSNIESNVVSIFAAIKQCLSRCVSEETHWKLQRPSSYCDHARTRHMGRLKGLKWSGLGGCGFDG